jgi:DedD protein
MTNQWRNRLMFLVIIIGLIVIFLPIFFAKYAMNDKSSPPPALPALEQNLENKEAKTELTTVGEGEPSAVPVNGANSTSVSPQVVEEKAQPEAEITAPVVEKPQITTPEPSITVAPAVVETTPSVVPAVSVVTKEIKTSTPKSHVVHSSPKPHMIQALQHRAGWVVQLGSFSDNTRAKQLVKTLHLKGFEAFSYTHLKQNKTIYRVDVGPFTRIEKARLLQDRIAREMNLHGFIVKFSATDID